MPRYYCDYCDTYLTHDSPSVRKQHNAGYKHKANVRAYYQQFEEQQTQSLIDQRIKEHLGQAAAFQQVGSVYAQHLAQRPRLPMIPPPILPIPGAASSPLVPGARPPIMPRPMPIPGYGGTASSLVGPPGASSLPMQMVNPQVPLPTMSAPTNVPVGMAAPSANGAPSTGQQSMYQVNPTAPSSGGYDMNHNAANMSRPSGGAPPMSTGAGDGLGYARPTESNQ